MGHRWVRGSVVAKWEHSSEPDYNPLPGTRLEKRKSAKGPRWRLFAQGPALTIAFHATVAHYGYVQAQTPHSKRRSWSGLPSSIELLDALPSWAKVIVVVVGIAGFFYSIAHYGLGSTLLHALFSP